MGTDSLPVSMPCGRAMLEEDIYYFRLYFIGEIIHMPCKPPISWHHSVGLNSFTEQWDHYYSCHLRMFASPTEQHHRHSSWFLQTLLLGATTDLFSILTVLPILEFSRKWNHIFRVLLWLTSFTEHVFKLYLHLPMLPVSTTVDGYVRFWSSTYQASLVFLLGYYCWLLNSFTGFCMGSVFSLLLGIDLGVESLGWMLS